MIFFRKKKEEKSKQIEEGPVRLSFAELEPWIKKHLDTTFEEVKPKAEQLRDRFQMILNSIKAVGKQLYEAEINESDVAQQFIPVINDAKNTILTAIQKETSDDLPKIESFDDVLEMRDRARAVLSRLGETGGSHRRTIHSFFGKHAKVLKLELSMVEKEMKRLHELIDDYTEKTSSLEDCRTSISSIKEAISARKEFEEKLEETEQEIEDLRSKEKELVGKVDEFKQTDEYRIHTQRKQELAKLKNASDDVLSEVNNALSRISRPVNKYTYEIGLDKESKALMESIMGDSRKLMDESKVDKFVEVLTKVKDGVQKGKISTKHPEKDVENLASLISDVNGYVGKYGEYHSSMKDLLKETTVVHNKIERMERELEQVRNDIQQKEEFVKDYSQKIAAAKNTIDEELRKISMELETVAGNKIEISM